MALIVMCPKCKNRQKTRPKNISSSIKTCVYCGHRFKVHTSPKKSRIMDRE